jgi:Ser/Thr protein kinase RdoA (MazF antagonist)
MTDADCPPPASQTPFADLTPGAVLDALDAVCLHGDGRLIQLNSYENRVFQVYLETGDVVVPKFYRPGRWSDAQILEEHSFSAELAAAEIPVVGPLALQVEPAPRQRVTLSGDPCTLAHSMGQRYSVSPRRAGRAPELEHSSTLEWIGRFIGRMHAVGAGQQFVHRGRLDIDTYGRGPRDFLLEHEWLPPQVLPRWLASVNAALDEVQRAFDSLPALRTLRLHGDCHPGNILWSDAGPHFVDLDDALTGPAVQDLWMLLSGDRASMTRQLGAVLSGYEDFMDFDWRELHLVEPLRTLRMIHHSAWIARRWNDPAFPAAFPWFNGAAYWQQQATQLDEQIDAMRETPLGARAY